MEVRIRIHVKRAWQAARRSWFWSGLAEILPCVHGSQLVESALLTPMLLVLAVGIADFSGAYNVKQNLNNAAREGARFAISQSELDLNCGSCSPAPQSVQGVRDVVANYLSDAGLTTCTVGSSATYSATNQTWSYGGSGCSGFLLTIERGYSFANGSTTVVATRVTLTYPYSWTISKVFGLLGNGSGPSLPPTLTTNAIMANLN